MSAPASAPPLAPAGSLPRRDPHRRPWPGRTVTVPGTSTALHVRDIPGPDAVPAVYVHGLAGSATNWTDLAALLSTRSAGTAVDLPGFGRSDPPTSGDHSPAGYAALLTTLLDAGARPVHLVGNSMGGIVALLVAARRPDLVRSLTLVSPAVPDLRPDPRRITDVRQLIALVPWLGARARADLAAVDPHQRAVELVQLCFADPSLVPPHRLDEAAEEITYRAGLAWGQDSAQRAGAALVRSWINRPSLWQLAATVRVPTLVVWGDRDRLVAPRLAGRTAAAIPGARLVVLPGVGHTAQLEAPVAVARAVAGLWDAANAGTWPAAAPGPSTAGR